MDIEKFKDAIAITATVVFFSGEKFCKPCRTIKPYFLELEEKYTNVQFIYVDIETNEELASKYKVKSVPCFKIFRNSVIIDEFTGANKELLLKCVKNLSATADLC